MLPMNPGFADKPKKILLLGAHPDDIEIGCGGTVLRLLNEWQISEVTWVVFSGNTVRKREAQTSASAFLKRAKDKTVLIRNYRDGYFPYDGGKIKDVFEDLKKKVSPDIVFTHYRDDRHQDHRVISDLTWNTYRNHFILEYEVPKYDGDLGSPNFFVHLNDATSREKGRLIVKHFASQQSKPWFSEDTFLALARLRGVESGAEGNFAEGFYCRKSVI